MTQVTTDQTTTIGSSRDWAEAHARQWLVQRGFSDVGVTSSGEHGGAALKGTDVVAQVKFSAQPVNLDEIDRLNAMMLATDRSKAFFFSVAGYDSDAHARADALGIVLLNFALDARPANDAAKRWLRPGTSPTIAAEHLKEGDRITAEDGGHRTVTRVLTRRVDKILHFLVTFDDGGEVDLMMGDKVRIPDDR